MDVLKKEAENLGFIAMGFSSPGEPLHFDKLAAWVSQGKHAGMSWLERNMDVRRDPSRLLKGCATIISLAYPYPWTRPSTPDGFTVSRYACPEAPDYHHRLKGLCGKLALAVKEAYPGSRTRICVDTAPILERSIAWKAGLGFVGKNTMLILPGYGSYFYLAEILCTAALPREPVRPEENRCGTCTLCVEACPTGALEAPFSLDAGRCLSYLTVEYGGAVSAAAGKRMENCFFGCDRCQEACPFNEGKTGTAISLPDIDAFLSMDEDRFLERFGKTALSRRGLQKIQTNIRAMKKGRSTQEEVQDSSLENFT